MNPWQQIVRTHIAAVDNKKIEPTRNPTKQCSVCKRFLSKTDFYASPDSKDGVRAKCKLCFIKIQNERRANVVP